MFNTQDLLKYNLDADLSIRQKPLPLSTFQKLLSVQYTVKLHYIEPQETGVNGSI